MSMRTMFGLLAVLVSAVGLGAQETTDTVPAAATPPPPEPDTAKWIGVATRPRSTVVSVTVTFPVGSDHDGDGQGGTAWLLAQTLESMAGDALGPDHAVSATASRNRFHLTLLSEPDHWEEGLSTLWTVVTRRDLSDDRFQRARARLVNRMTFEAGAPVREFEVEAARIYGAGDAEWIRPPDGVVESLQGLTVQTLEQYRRRHLTTGTAVAAVVGPVEPETAAAGVARVLGSGSTTHRAAQLAWRTGDRSVLTRDITNTAFAFAYPLPPDHARTDAEFLAHVLSEKLNSDPPDPGVYSATTQIMDAPGGALLVIEAAVFPEVGERWEGKILDAVRDTRLTDADEDVYFPWQHRRFRSRALDAEAAPEALGRRMTHDLLRQGSVRDMDAETRALTAGSLATLANALGEPHILIFGPDLGAQQDR